LQQEQTLKKKLPNPPWEWTKENRKAYEDIFSQYIYSRGPENQLDLYKQTNNQGVQTPTSWWHSVFSESAALTTENKSVGTKSTWSFSNQPLVTEPGTKLCYFTYTPKHANKVNLKFINYWL
jgi:hypothetical protein